MPCGDSTTFPTDAVTKIGQAFVSKQFSFALVSPACDVLCFAANKIGGLNPTPTPFPKPTFAAGPDLPDDAEVERLGHMLCAAADAHRNGEALAETGAKAAPNLTALPWGTIISVLITILQGLLLGVSPSPIPNPTPAPAPE